MSDINPGYANQTITIVNNLTGKELTRNDLIFTLPASSVTLSCDATIDGQSIYKYFDKEVLWDFGDGTTILGKTATHYYNKPGYYQISCVFFDENNKAYPNNAATKQYIKVTDVFQTTINFTSKFLDGLKAGSLNDIKAGQKALVGEFISTIDKTVENDIPIKCYTSKSNSKDIFDLAYKDPYTYLLPYSAYYAKDSNEPTLSIFPNYRKVYCAFETVEARIHMNLYVLESSTEEIDQFNTLKLFNDIDTTTLTSIDNYYDVVNNLPSYTFININSLKEIPTENYYYIGKIGIAEIYYKDDLPSNNKDSLIFVLDQAYFQDKNILLSKDTINLVSLGTELVIRHNSYENVNIYTSTNGVPPINNGTSEGINVYNFETVKFIDINSQFVCRLSAWDNKLNDLYFIKDLPITSASDSSSYHPEYYDINFKTELTAPDGNLYRDYGSIFGIITPKKEEENIPININLGIDSTTISDELSLTFIDPESFTDPKSKYYLDLKQKYNKYPAYEWWEVYKTHPVFENVPLLDKFMMGIFEQNDLLQYIINKGDNFVDDTNNIKTCSIKNLLSILDSINSKTTLYSTVNFNKPLAIAQLLKILSINHSRLIGTEQVIPDEFITENGFAGKNRGKELKITDNIYFPGTTSSSTIDDICLWPKIIVYDKFAKEYTVPNTSLLVKLADSPIKSDENGLYFNLKDYQLTWGWNILPGDGVVKGYDANENPIYDYSIQLEKFYSFYEYIEDKNTEIIDSYLEPSTISENVKNYNTWTKFDGSMERLIKKAIIEELDI